MGRVFGLIIVLIKEPIIHTESEFIVIKTKEHNKDRITNILYGLIYFNIRKYNFIYKTPSPFLIIL